MPGVMTVAVIGGYSDLSIDLSCHHSRNTPAKIISLVSVGTLSI